MTKVAEAVEYALNGGGKRIRPALCIAAYEAVAKKPADDSVKGLANAFELIHTYSLVHDDLPCMDDDDLRRGRATTHKVFGDQVAMLAGAALIPLAFAQIPDARRQTLHAELAKAAGATGMVGGQVLDLEAEGRVHDVDYLERIHAAKTGALLRGALRAGGLAANANEGQLRALDEYGRHLGLAFQITDDVLDETATSDELGKTAGKDRETAKATYPALLGLQAAIERAMTEMEAGLRCLFEEDLATETLVDLCRFAVERKR
ncbi:MAG TPA: farnesyl diphosphate synthase [Longimicrobiales bacterium]|nr:farnesyl diphosphate synthase [Longimicrobiales bacterium]